MSWTHAPKSGTSLANKDDLRQRVLEYLHRHHTMSLATDGPCGLWASTVFYVNLEFALYFQSNEATRHVQNIAINARVAATVNQDPEDWRAIKGIQLEGQANVVTDAEERRRVREAFVLRYAFVETLWGDRTSDKAVIIRVGPERLVFHDHTYTSERLELSTRELNTAYQATGYDAKP